MIIHQQKTASLEELKVHELVTVAGEQADAICKIVACMNIEYMTDAVRAAIAAHLRVCQLIVGEVASLACTGCPYAIKEMPRAGRSLAGATEMWKRTLQHMGGPTE